MTGPAVLAAVALLGLSLGVWLTLGLHALAVRRRPSPVCVLASAPSDATAEMARVLAAEVRPTPRRDDAPGGPCPETAEGVDSPTNPIAGTTPRRGVSRIPGRSGSPG